MLRLIRRAALLLILIGVGLAYIQLIVTEHWQKFAQYQISVFHGVRSIGDGPRKQTTSDTNFIYFNFNETDAAENMHDVYHDSSPDDYDSEDYEEADDTENEETDTEGRTNVSSLDRKESIRARNRRKNRLATLDLKRFIEVDTNFTSKPLMVLFSSWASSQDKARVHEAIVRLWNSWPSIKPVVLTTDPVVEKTCKNSGWDILPVTKSDRRCHGPPILTTMFTEVIKNHDAYFYGFSNADIIFGEGLEKTIKFLYYYFSPWKYTPVLVVGRRHNIDFIKHENFTLQTPNDVSQLTKYGKLVIRSTDFFFTNRHFPWGQAPRVTVGRPFVVRSIISWALRKGFHVIEATKTIESVHLTTKDGIYASWHKKGVMCNRHVLASGRWSVPTSIGHCECARMETFYDANNMIKLRHRPPSRKYCGRHIM